MSLISVQSNKPSCIVYQVIAFSPTSCSPPDHDRSWRLCKAQARLAGGWFGNSQNSSRNGVTWGFLGHMRKVKSFPRFLTGSKGNQLGWRTERTSQPGVSAKKSKDVTSSQGLFLMPGNYFGPRGHLWIRQEWEAEMPWEGGRGRLGCVCSKISCVKTTGAKSELLFQGACGQWAEQKHLTCWQRGPWLCGEQLSVWLCPAHQCYS